MIDIQADDGLTSDEETRNYRRSLIEKQLKEFGEWLDDDESCPGNSDDDEEECKLSKLSGGNHLRSCEDIRLQVRNLFQGTIDTTESTTLNANWNTEMIGNTIDTTESSTANAKWNTDMIRNSQSRKVSKKISNKILGLSDLKSGERIRSKERRQRSSDGVRGGGRGFRRNTSGTDLSAKSRGLRRSGNSGTDLNVKARGLMRSANSAVDLNVKARGLTRSANSAVDLNVKARGLRRSGNSGTDLNVKARGLMRNANSAVDLNVKARGLTRSANSAVDLNVKASGLTRSADSGTNLNLQASGLALSANSAAGLNLAALGLTRSSNSAADLVRAARSSSGRNAPNPLLKNNVEKLTKSDQDESFTPQALRRTRSNIEKNESAARRALSRTRSNSEKNESAARPALSRTRSNSEKNESAVRPALSRTRSNSEKNESVARPALSRTRSNGEKDKSAASPALSRTSSNSEKDGSAPRPSLRRTRSMPRQRRSTRSPRRGGASGELSRSQHERTTKQNRSKSPIEKQLESKFEAQEAAQSRDGERIALRRGRTRKDGLSSSEHTRSRARKSRKNPKGGELSRSEHGTLTTSKQRSSVSSDEMSQVRRVDPLPISFNASVTDLENGADNVSEDLMQGYLLMKQKYQHTWDAATGHALLNQERQKRGIELLSRNKVMDEKATEYASRVAESNGVQSSFAEYTGHVLCGSSVVKIYESVMKQESHAARAALLNPQFQEVGLGVARSCNGTVYLCQLFQGHFELVCTVMS